MAVKNEQINKENLYDAIVVGGGPAGLTAALYLARARYRVLVVEKERFGGQISITNEVVNYPGVEKISGSALAETMRKQAEGFGAEFLMAEVTGIEDGPEVKTVHTTRGALQCFGVLLAIGAKPRKAGFQGEEEFRGHGVAYCATCDGEFFAGKDVYVIGGGFAAAEEGVFLTKYARQVHILIRGKDFSCAPAAAEEARRHEKIAIHTNTVVEAVEGDSVPRVIRYRNKETGEVTERRAPEGDTFGVFVLAGYAPETELVKGLVALDERGNILTDARQQTNVEGIFAAGDVCVKNLRQVATATGEAAAAATEMERHLAAMQEKTGLVPQRPQSNPAAKTAQPAAPAAEPASASDESSLFTPEMVAQLNAVFGRMANPVVLELSLDQRAASAELKAYAEALAGLTDKVSVRVLDAAAQADLPESDERAQAPCVSVCNAEGLPTGLAFHGVPGGHEFTSFVLGLYNAAGPGQPIDDAAKAAAQAVSAAKVQVLVSLSCTMCPDTVVAAQRVAALNPQVSAHAYDVAHFPELKERYNVMSVPCVIVNDGEKVSFGKKGIQEMLDLLG